MPRRRKDNLAPFSSLGASMRLRAYLWVCWRKASVGKKKKDEDTQADQVMRQLCGSDWPEVDREAISDAAIKYPVVFIKDAEVLCVFASRPETAQLFGVKASTLKMFYNGKTIQQWLAEWADAGAVTWRQAGIIAPRKHLKDDGLFTTIVDWETEKIPFLGVPVIGHHGEAADHEEAEGTDKGPVPGGVLIGIRDILGVNALQPGNRLAWLWQRPGVVRPKPSSVLPSWWDAAETERFKAFAVPENVATVAAAAAREDDDVAFLLSLEDPVRQQRVPKEAQNGLIVSSGSWLEAATEVMHLLQSGDLPAPRSSHLVFGAEQLMQRCAENPVLWSTLVDTDGPIQLVGHPEDLVKALVKSGTEVLAASEHVGHPAIESFRSRPGSFVAVSGVPGSGRSVALSVLGHRVLKSDRGPGLGIVVRPWAGPQDFARCARMLTMIAPPTHHVFMLDNADQSFRNGHSQVLSGIGQLCLGKRHSILASFRSGDFEAAPQFDGSERLHLGWNELFVQGVLREYHAAHFEGAVAWGTYHECFRRARTHSLKDVLLGYERALRGISDEEEYRSAVTWWRDQARRVRPDDDLCLRLLATLSSLNFVTVPLELALEHHSQHAPAFIRRGEGYLIPKGQRDILPLSSSRTVLNRLERIGWLTIKGTEVHPVGPAMQGFRATRNLDEEVEDLVRWVLAHAALVPASWHEVLKDIAADLADKDGRQ